MSEQSSAICPCAVPRTITRPKPEDFAVRVDTGIVVHEFRVIGWETGPKGLVPVIEGNVPADMLPYEWHLADLDRDAEVRLGQINAGDAVERIMRHRANFDSFIDRLRQIESDL